MSDTPAPTSTPPALAPVPDTEASSLGRVVLIILGLLFILGWIAAHLLWGTLSLMGGLMANDAGAASPDAHSGLILGLLGGQVLAGAAGIPGGLAFFWRGRRKLLIWLFAILFVSGTLLQILSFGSFFGAAATAPTPA